MKKVMKISLSLCLVLVMLFLISPTQVEAKSTVKLDKTKVTVYVGKTTILKVSGTSKTVKWSSSNKKIATVSSKGKVTAKKKGTATITAKVSGKTYKCKVTVKNPYLNATKVCIDKGKTYTLKLIGATAKKFTSSNKSVATVSSKGKITAKKAGKATITVTDSNKKTYKCTVEVQKSSAECEHRWNPATCLEPKTCVLCHKTEGAALGHDWRYASCGQTTRECRQCGRSEKVTVGHFWRDATCYYPKYCPSCGKTEGSALGHDWQEATKTTPKTCKRCGKTEGSALGEETPWKYTDSTHRCKTMYDGTVVNQELIVIGNYSVWGYYDEKAEIAINNAVVDILNNTDGYRPYNISLSERDSARENAVIFALKYWNGAVSCHFYYGNYWGIPNVDEDKQYIALSDAGYLDAYIGCFVLDHSYQGSDDYTYGPTWRDCFGTFYGGSY